MTDSTPDADDGVVDLVTFARESEARTARAYGGAELNEDLLVFTAGAGGPPHSPGRERGDATGGMWDAARAGMLGRAISSPVRRTAIIARQGPGMEQRYAVIGESEGYPTLYHMNQGRAQAESLCQRREAMIRRPCFVVPMADWHRDPLLALRQAEAARFGKGCP